MLDTTTTPARASIAVSSPRRNNLLCNHQPIDTRLRAPGAELEPHQARAGHNSTPPTPTVPPRTQRQPQPQTLSPSAITVTMAAEYDYDRDGDRDLDHHDSPRVTRAHRTRRHSNSTSPVITNGGMDLDRAVSSSFV